jgi:hypothetical protein
VTTKRQLLERLQPGNAMRSLRVKETKQFMVRGTLWLLLLLASHTAVLADAVRPSRDTGPTRVEVVMAVLDVSQVSSARQNFHASVFFRLRWTDPRLAHDEENQMVPLGQIWQPRFLLLNQQLARSSFPNVASVSPAGQVTYRQRVTGIFSQPLDLRDFPSDRQNFSIQLATGYTADELELVVDPRSGISDVLSLPDWDILGADVKTVTIEMLPGTAATGVTAAVISFQAERRQEYFIYQAIIPLVLIVAMAWIVFWIDPSAAGTQISVSITAVLTLIAFRFAATSDLPKVDYMTRLDFFVLGSTVLVFGGLAQAVFTMHLAKVDMLPRARKIDLWCRWLFPIAFFLLVAETMWLRMLG